MPRDIDSSEKKSADISHSPVPRNVVEFERSKELENGQAHQEISKTRAFFGSVINFFKDLRQSVSQSPFQSKVAPQIDNPPIPSEKEMNAAELSSKLSDMQVPGKPVGVQENDAQQAQVKSQESLGLTNPNLPRGQQQPATPTRSSSLPKGQQPIIPSRSSSLTKEPGSERNFNPSLDIIKTNESRPNELTKSHESEISSQATEQQKVREKIAQSLPGNSNNIEASANLSLSMRMLQTESFQISRVEGKAEDKDRLAIAQAYLIIEKVRNAKQMEIQQVSSFKLKPQIVNQTVPHPEAQVAKRFSQEITPQSTAKPVPETHKRNFSRAR